MADTCCVYTFGGLTINATTGDTLFTDFDDGDIQGLDGAPIRKQIDDLGQANGANPQTAFFGARIVTFTGIVLVRSVEDITSQAFAAAVNTVTESARTTLEGLLNSTSTLAWTPNGLTAHTLTAYYGTEGGEFVTSGPMPAKKFSFTLVATNPTISVA